MIQISESIWKTGKVELVLSAGEKLSGKVHKGWSKSDIGGLLSKTVDLKSA